MTKDDLLKLADEIEAMPDDAAFGHWCNDDWIICEPPTDTLKALVREWREMTQFVCESALETCPQCKVSKIWVGTDGTTVHVLPRCDENNPK